MTTHPSGLRLMVRCEPFWRNRFDFVLGGKHDGDRVLICRPIEVESMAHDDKRLLVEQQPTFSLESDKAQFLMDELWHCGLRPTEGSGSAGSLAATEKHLQDMRALVFKLPPK